MINKPTFPRIRQHSKTLGFLKANDGPQQPGAGLTGGDQCYFR